MYHASFFCLSSFSALAACTNVEASFGNLLEPFIAVLVCREHELHYHNRCLHALETTNGSDGCGAVSLCAGEYLAELMMASKSS